MWNLSFLSRISNIKEGFIVDFFFRSFQSLNVFKDLLFRLSFLLEFSDFFSNFAWCNREHISINNTFSDILRNIGANKLSNFFCVPQGSFVFYFSDRNSHRLFEIRSQRFCRIAFVLFFLDCKFVALERKSILFKDLRFVTFFIELQKGFSFGNTKS